MLQRGYRSVTSQNAFFQHLRHTHAPGVRAASGAAAHMTDCRIMPRCPRSLSTRVKH